MARRCLCSRLLAFAKEDPRLGTLPLAPRMLWLLLAEAMAMPGFDGVLPFSDPRRVSVLVRESQTDVETHLETLIGERLILREGDTLVCPLLRDASARTIAARRNGGGGGRPRKGETAEDMHRRRQQEMILPIEGGQRGEDPKPTETQRWETPSAGAAARGPTSTSISTETSDSLVARGFVQLAKDAIAEGALTYRRLNFEEAKVWLRLGEQHGKTEAETRAIVLGAVRKQVSWKSPDDVKSLRFFTGLITRVMQGEEELDDLVADVTDHRPSDYQLASDAWFAGGMKGPAPVRQRAA